MISCQLLAWIDLRLQQIKENKLPFGNLNVIILGDWGQIPPISGTSLYNNLVKDDIGAQGKRL